MMMLAPLGIGSSVEWGAAELRRPDDERRDQEGAPDESEGLDLERDRFARRAGLIERVEINEVVHRAPLIGARRPRFAGSRNRQRRGEYANVGIGGFGACESHL